MYVLSVCMYGWWMHCMYVPVCILYMNKNGNPQLMTLRFEVPSFICRLTLDVPLVHLNLTFQSLVYLLPTYCRPQLYKHCQGWLFTVGEHLKLLLSAIYCWFVFYVLSLTKTGHKNKQFISWSCNFNRCVPTLAKESGRWQWLNSTGLRHSCMVYINGTLVTSPYRVRKRVVVSALT